MTSTATPTGGSASPIEIAKQKSDEVQEQLAIAGAELQLTNTILDQAMPADKKQGDLGKAIDQNAATQQRVDQAAEDLSEVGEKLQEEVAHRKHLEQELARRTGN